MRINNTNTISVVRVARLCLVGIVFSVVLCPSLMADTADDMFDRAKTLSENGDYKEAIQTLLDFQEKFPKDERVPRAQYLMGRYQHKRNYLNNAIKEYKYVIQDFPDTLYAAAARHRMADIYVHRQTYAKAAKVLEECAEEFKGTAAGFHALRRLGDTYLRMNKKKKKDAPQKAVDAFQRMLKYNVLQLMDNDKGPGKKRDREIGFVSNVDSDIHRAVMYLADRAIKKEKYEKAQKIYGHLPDMWEKVRLIIDLLYRQKKFGQIHNLVQKMEDENYWHAQSILMNFFLKEKSAHGLKMQIRDVCEDHDQHPKLTALLQNLLEDMDHFADQKRVDVYEVAATKYRPLRRELEYKICELVKEERPDILRSFILTYAKGQDVEQVKRWRGIYLELAKQRKKAQKQYREMEDKAQGHLYIAESYHGEYAQEAGMVDLKKALQEYMKIRKKYYGPETTAQAYWERAQLFKELGEKKKAIAELKELERRFATLPEWQKRAGLEIGDFYRGWGQYKKAIDAYRKVDRNYPDSRTQRIAVYRIGQCYERLGQKEKAIEIFLECIRRFEGSGIQSRAHTRLEVKYEIPDLIIQDRVKEQEKED